MSNFIDELADPFGYLLGGLFGIKEANMKHFKWLGPSTVTRSKEGQPGMILDTDHIYEAAAFTEGVVAEWVATGFAEPVEVNVNTTTTLKVKNVIVKSNAPKIGE